jgi:hypothetical protein
MPPMTIAVRYVSVSIEDSTLHGGISLRDRPDGEKEKDFFSDKRLASLIY